MKNIDLGLYELVGKKPVKVDNLSEWGKKYSDTRRVAQTMVGPYRVSTVFLGIDHNHFRDGPPLLFETMIFDDSKVRRRNQELDYQKRFSTWEEAEAGHDKAIDYARKLLKTP